MSFCPLFVNIFPFKLCIKRKKEFFKEEKKEKKIIRKETAFDDLLQYFHRICNEPSRILIIFFKEIWDFKK